VRENLRRDFQIVIDNGRFGEFARWVQNFIGTRNFNAMFAGAHSQFLSR
jgi:hypothetical protein